MLGLLASEIVAERPTVRQGNVWVYDPDRLTLCISRPFAPYHRSAAYYVDLEELTTAKDVIATIHHLCGKRWFAGIVVSDFIESLYVYHPLADLAYKK